MKPFPVIILLLTLALAAGCDQSEDSPADAAVPAPVQNPPPTSPSTRPASSSLRVLFLGDSLTAGYGLEMNQAYPAIVERRLQEEFPVEVVNAGVSGDTTAGGLGRIDWLLRQAPDIIVVGLGGNDGLRGVEPKASEANLREIVRRSREAGAQVLLLGMLIPPNYGPEYTQAFREIYPRIAQEMDVPLVPFLLEDVGGVRELNQGDGIHPTAQGQEILARNVLPALRPLIERRLADEQ